MYDDSAVNCPGWQFDIKKMMMGNMTLPRNKSRRVTLDDVAARARVSAVTASRVLRKPEMVSADLRARADNTDSELGYIPNQLASALACITYGAHRGYCPLPHQRRVRRLPAGLA